jgi:HAD superfamily hydrolase (TIGR01458 family)
MTSIAGRRTAPYSFDPTIAEPAGRSAAADPPGQLRARLAGVRALLLDLDGVIVLRGSALPGASAALGELERRGIPYRLVTNASLESRGTLAARLEAMGPAVPADRIVSAVAACAAYTAGAFRDQPLYLFSSRDAATEFEGQWLLADAEAAAPGTRAAAVVVGDAEDGFTYARLNAAFRLVRTGARLVAMHRNAWWLTPAGETLDSGAFVRGLEYATGRRALLIGKPGPTLFRVALASFAPGNVLRPEEVAMVGDDLGSDIAGAARLGLRTVLVLTGKHGPADLDRAARHGPSGRPGRLPDAVAASLSAVIAALD